MKNLIHIFISILIVAPPVQLNAHAISIVESSIEAIFLSNTSRHMEVVCPPDYFPNKVSYQIQDPMIVSSKIPHPFTLAGWLEVALPHTLPLREGEPTFVRLQHCKSIGSCNTTIDGGNNGLKIPDNRRVKLVLNAECLKTY